MATREEKLNLILQQLANMERFSLEEAIEQCGGEQCGGVTPRFLKDTVTQLVRDGMLNATDDELAWVEWPLYPDSREVSGWVERQIRGTQVTQTPLEDRPRERLVQHGPANLSTAELLAILIRVGIRGESAVDAGRKLANFFANSLPELRHYSSAELKAISCAVSITSYAQIMAGIELGRRVADAEQRQKFSTIRITSTAVAVQYCVEAFRFLACDGVQEEFHIVTLDTKHKPIRSHQITVGTLDASLVHPREVFRPAIRDAASAVLLIHNHPSGDSTPSREDHQVTARLADAGKLIGIEVLDHIIVTRNGGLSLREAT